jgi:hypothetical protein
MEIEAQVNEVRLQQFEREFGRSREVWRTLYLSLRDNGDSHSSACETIRMEIQMANR